MLRTCLPSPRIYQKHELATLNFLRTSPTVATNFSMLARDAEYAYFRIKNAQAGYGFESWLEADLDGTRRRIFFGGKVDVENGLHTGSSYYLAFGKNLQTPEALIRKIHFDFQPQAGQSDKPVFHMQYAGQLSRTLRDCGCTDQSLQPKESKPRIPFIPVSLALLLDIIFVESLDGNCSRLHNSSEWCDLVKSNETAFLDPFFDRMKSPGGLRMRHWYARA